LLITKSVRTKMFKVFQETGSVRQVATQCGVHIKTAKKYRVRDSWDARVDRIESKVQEREENIIVNRRLRNVKALDKAIESILGQLDDGADVDTKLLPRLVVAQDHLIGRGAADEEGADLSPAAQEALQFLLSLGERGLIQLAQVISAELADKATQQRAEERAKHKALIPVAEA